MPILRRRFVSPACVLVCLLALGACTSSPRAPAPVEDRGAAPAPGGMVPPPVGGAPAEIAPVRLPPGAENAGKPGYYTVKPGENLTRIGLDHGMSARELARLNNLENPNRIEVGQVLRVAPAGTLPGESVAVSRPVSSGGAAASSVSATPLPATSAAARPASAIAAASAPSKPAESPPTVAGAPDEAVQWAWPVAGAPSVLGGFDEQKTKGIDLGGKAGDAVLAAADGRVVFAGNSLRGYGNLVILKHNNTYLSAYAHNQTLLVKEDQTVRRGQKIAEMGNSDADRVKLHFEIRRQGKPVDPAKLLPAP